MNTWTPQLLFWCKGRGSANWATSTETEESVALRCQTRSLERLFDIFVNSLSIVSIVVWSYSHPFQTSQSHPIPFHTPNFVPLFFLLIESNSCYLCSPWYMALPAVTPLRSNSPSLCSYQAPNSSSARGGTSCPAALSTLGFGQVFSFL